MNRETVSLLVRALPDVKEDGNTFAFDTGWEITLHAGRSGVPMNVLQVTRIKLENTIALIETKKGQRVVMILDEIRGLTAEPSSGDRKGQKPGFM